MSYRHGFLISTLAHPVDSPLQKSVIYICEHSPNGSLGLILNKRLDLNLGDIAPKAPAQALSSHIFLGGTAETQGKGFVLHEPVGHFCEGTTELSADLHMTTSHDILSHIFKKRNTKHRIFVGYTSWAPYQLEYEVAQDLWLFLDYNQELLWSPAFDLWLRCYDALSLQPHHIGSLDRGILVPQ